MNNYERKYSMKKVIAAVTLMAVSTSFAFAASQAHFDKLDTNGDQFLSMEEYAVNLEKYFAKKNITDPAEQKKRAANGFKKKDLNGDGKISFEELDTKPKK